MPYKIKLLPVVKQDLQKAKEWYHSKGGTSIAEQFKAEINKEIDYIGEFPEHYQMKYKDLRQSLLNRFPYAIFYKLEKETIVIIAVLHTSRNPVIIQKRK